MEKHLKYQLTVVILLMVITSAISISFLIKGYSDTKQLYQHSYAVNNTLKQLTASIHQMHLALQNQNNDNLIVITQQHTANKNSLTSLKALYLGDQRDVADITELYNRWLIHDIDQQGEIFSQDINSFSSLIQGLEILSAKTEQRAEDLYSVFEADLKQSIVLIVLALSLAIFLIGTLWFRTLADMRKIRANRKQYLYLIDQNVMITAISEDGSIFEISNRLCRFLSKNKNQVIGKQLKEVFFSQDAKLYEEMWNQVRSGANWHGDIEIRSFDSTSSWLGIDVLPMQNSDYSYSGYRLLANDVTDRKSLEKISITDSMTGLLNRRTLEETIERQTALARRHKTAMILGVFDVDFFKQYNDQYGHIAGDKALIHIATVVSKMLARPSDFVFRIGGEEFCFIFQGENEQSALAYIEKIREAVRGLQIDHERSSVDSYVTISIGAVFYDGSDTVNGKVLLSDADDNLYRAKEQRNSTVQTVYGELVGIEPTKE